MIPLSELGAILMALGRDGKYWLFVVGVLIGAFLTRMKVFALVLSFGIGLLQGAMQQYFVFLQAGIVAGIVARAL